jgi:hypothetical protein
MIFLPFLRLKEIKRNNFQTYRNWCGSIKFDVLFYFQSFQFLTVPECYFFSVFTPIYITLLNDILSKQFHKDIYLLYNSCF